MDLLCHPDKLLIVFEEIGYLWVVFHVELVFQIFQLSAVLEEPRQVAYNPIHGFNYIKQIKQAFEFYAGQSGAPAQPQIPAIEIHVLHHVQPDRDHRVREAQGSHFPQESVNKRHSTLPRKQGNGDLSQLLDDKSNAHDQGLRNNSLIYYKFKKGVTGEWQEIPEVVL